MHADFLAELEFWVTSLLRQKALTSEEGRPSFIGAGDLATMISDFALTRLIEDAECYAFGCGLDDVSDDEIMHAVGFDRESLAAAFVGAAVELEAWTGDTAAAFLKAHGVQGDDAERFCETVDFVSQKLGERGRHLLGIEHGAGGAQFTATHRSDALAGQQAV